jgi:transcriptional antiterminator NusG
MAMNWYAVQTFAGFENKALASLKDAIRRANLTERFGELLVPTETVVEVKNGKKKTTTRKVYPSYIFVQMEMDNVTWSLVTNTPKVAGFLGNSRNPPPLEEKDLKMVLNKVEEEEKEKPVIHFERGESVRIITGPFANVTAKVEEVNQARAKLKVLVTIFGRTTPYDLDYTEVERIG